MIIGIDVVFIHAKYPKKLGEWYKDILEIDIKYQDPDYGWQEFSFPEDRPETRFAIDYGGPDPSEVEQQSIIISFSVSNIHEAIDNLEKKGVNFFGKGKISDVGPTLISTFQDPEGNWIQISQRKQ